MADDLLARFRRIRSSSIGPVAYRQLIARFGSAKATVDAIPDLARRGAASSRDCSASRKPSASGAVRMAPLELDLGGRLDRHAGNRVSLRTA